MKIRITKLRVFDCVCLHQIHERRQKINLREHFVVFFNCQLSFCIGSNIGLVIDGPPFQFSLRFDRAKVLQLGFTATNNKSGSGLDTW